MYPNSWGRFRLLIKSKSKPNKAIINSTEHKNLYKKQKLFNYMFPSRIACTLPLKENLFFYSQQFWHQMYMRLSSHQTIPQLSRHHLGVLQFNSDTDLNSAQTHRLRAQSHKLQVQTPVPDCHLYFWTISYNSGFPHSPIRFNNLLYQLTEPRETHYLRLFRWTAKSRAT